VLRDVINEIRGSIKEGTLWELVERSAMYNPSMFAAVRRLKEHSDHLEENAPRSTRRFMGSSGLSLARPEFTRMRNSLSEFEIPRSGKEKIMLTNWTITHSINVMDRMWTRQPEGAEPILATPFGLVPFDIIDMYPISQSLFPPPSSIDDEMRGYMEEMIELKRDDNKELIAWDGIEEPPFAPSKNDPHDLNTRKIRAILRFQFGKAGDRWVDDVLFTQGRELKIVTSRKTGKIRNVMEIDDQGGSAHLLSLRADDGLFNLRWEAARRLHESSSKPHFRVVVEEGTGEFNAKGYNVFCKFVLEVDPDIRAGDDVLIVDAEDTLYGVGRAAVSSRMMLESGSGTAVKTRDGAEKQ
jgi:7-cyano-7-deazaguanine tRNA-ribosyltransferase